MTEALRDSGRIGREMIEGEEAMNWLAPPQSTMCSDAGGEETPNKFFARVHSVNAGRTPQGAQAPSLVSR